MDILEQTVGTLGLLETWVMIVYGMGSLGPFKSFEKLIFELMAMFELAGYAVMCLSWRRIVCGKNSTTSADRKDNFKTLTRDVLHNLVHPRSAPGSTARREFAAWAWVGVLVSGLPVLVFTPPYTVWGNHFDTPGYVLVAPSVVGVLAIVAAVVGCVYLETNRTSYVVTVLYLNTKLLCLLLLEFGYDRLLVRSAWNGNFPTGLVLALLQVAKVASAMVAVGKYLHGKPDEELPKLNSLCRSGHT